MPAVISVHGAVGDARKGSNRVLRTQIEFFRPVSPDVIDLDIAQAEKGDIEARPHVLADDVTYLAGVLPSCGETVPDAIGVAGLESQVGGECIGVRQHELLVPEVRFQIASRRCAEEPDVQTPPTPVYLLDRPILKNSELVREQTTAVLRPFEVAADPVKPPGAPRQHIVTRTTPRDLFRRHPDLN